MVSESTRMCTAEEAAFRIPYPNSKTRRSLVIILDEESRHILDEAAELPWSGARFFSFKKTEPLSEALDSIIVDALLEGADGSLVRLTDEVAAGADVVVMITSAGETAEAAAAIGNICFVRNVMTTGLILSEKHEGADASLTLRNLRPYAAMLVVASGDDYIQAMLAALRA